MRLGRILGGATPVTPGMAHVAADLPARGLLGVRVGLEHEVHRADGLERVLDRLVGSADVHLHRRR